MKRGVWEEGFEYQKMEWKSMPSSRLRRTSNN